MKFLRFFIIIFISLTTPIKADLYKNLINQLEGGEKLIFIRHAYAPGNGDPAGFNLNDCSTQRNLSDDGRKQALRIGEFFTKNKIEIDKVISSEWCRCKETAKIAFKNYSTNSFLNSFYSLKFSKNKDKQVKAFNYYIKNLESKKNSIFVTHYVFISEVLNYGPSSGEIVVSDKNLNIIGSVKIDF
ncbi:histidine phosphatase family protein [Candidatus Pelagibacter sp.]|nr:histidine phosphatase family protein [Candidatus Pelagibacter sp.]